MKTLKTLFILCAGVTLSACSDLTPANNYSITVSSPLTGSLSVGYHYANEQSDSLIFYTNVPWSISTYSGDDSWVTFGGNLSGSADQMVSYGVSFTPNRTETSRYVSYRITDTDNSNKAYTTFAFSQFATRSDGSLGDAALVKKITGDDGSVITLAYDALDRPVALTLQTDSLDREMTFVYDDEDHTLTVNQSKCQFNYKDTTYQTSTFSLAGTLEDTNMQGVNAVLYIPRMLSSLSSDGEVTLSKTTSTSSSTESVDVSAAYASFTQDGLYSYSYENGLVYNDVLGNFVDSYGYYYNGNGSLQVDSLHLADSVAVYHRYSDASVSSNTYTLSYSKVDNRKTSVDANQLILGINHCDPFLLVSFFKHARITSVISKAVGKHNTYEVSTTTHSDGSVNTLTVKDKYGRSKTYTFTY